MLNKEEAQACELIVKFLEILKIARPELIPNNEMYLEFESHKDSEAFIRGFFQTYEVFGLTYEVLGLDEKGKDSPEKYLALMNNFERAFNLCEKEQ